MSSFRPNSSTVYACGAGQPTLTVDSGPLVTELQQTFGTWCTHVVRLLPGANHIEMEWTVGPIPLQQTWIPTPPPPPPPPGQCLGWKSTSGSVKPCNATIAKTEGGQCNCAHGATFAVDANQHTPFTCDQACAGKACVGWKQTAGCSGALEPKNNHPCDYEVPVSSSGFCQCSLGHRVGGQDWNSGWGCGVAKGGTCAQLCMGKHDDDWGKEVIMRYQSDVKNNGAFHTDANGREMVSRKTNGRGPSYPAYQVNEPVAGNYYPVNSMITLDDGAVELAVIVDTSLGGASLRDGEIELMVHRRVMQDDSRGVQEPLNETMCGCNDIGAAPGSMGAHGHEADGGCQCAGLTMRGRHFIVFDTLEKSHEIRRQLVETLNFGPTLAFAPAGTPKPPVPTSSFISKALPANVKLLTMTSNYLEANGNRVMLRLAHMYSVGEHPTLSQPVTVSLVDVFGKAGLTIQSAEETSLTGNQDAKDMDKRRRTKLWHTEDNAHLRPVMRARLDPADDALSVTLGPMEIKTFWVTFA